jgi:condensation domain-containing protein
VRPHGRQRAASVSPAVRWGPLTALAVSGPLTRAWISRRRALNRVTSQIDPADLDRAREELIRQRLSRRPGQRRPTGLRVPPRQEQAPLSFAQQRLWFLEQLWPGRPPYVVPAGYRIRGPLDVPAVQRAVATVLDRHESLRTCFPVRAGRPYQHVMAAVPGPNVTDLSGAADPVAAAREIAVAQAGLTFNLAEGPLVRTRLLRLGAEDHVLLVTVHHIVIDGMSIDRFAAEISTAYAGAELPDLPIQYRDFAAWQRQHLADSLLDRDLAYWRRRLAGAPAGLNLPIDRPRPDSPSFAGAAIRVVVPPGVAAGLRELARAHSCGLYAVTLAAYHTLLARYTGATDLVVGTTIAGRVRAEIENLIGFFVNTLPIRAELADDPPFTELMRRVHETAVEAQEHQELPFEKLVEELAPSRDPAQLPLTQVLFNLVTGLNYATLDLPGTEVTDFTVSAKTARFELELHLLERGDRLAGEFIYATDLFDHRTVRAFMEHYLNILAAVCDRADQRVSQVPIMPNAPRRN